MKLNKKEGQSVDASIPLRRGNKIIMGGRGKDLVEDGWGREKRGRSGVRGDRREVQRSTSASLFLHPYQ